MANRMIHIGQRIKEVFEEQPKSHTVEWFANKLHCKRANIYNIFNRVTIDTDLLLHISRILNHDFFHDLTSELHFTSPKDVNYDATVYDNLMSSFSTILKEELRQQKERLDQQNNIHG